MSMSMLIVNIDTAHERPLKVLNLQGLADKCPGLCSRVSTEAVRLCESNINKLMQSFDS